jgi:heme exporter protein D
MYFPSLEALWSMDGHGAYVWSAYAIVGVVLVLLVSDPLRRSRGLLARVRRRLAPGNEAL